MHTDHATRAIDWAAKVRENANRLERENKELKVRHDDDREKVASALGSRELAFDALRAVAAVHQEGVNRHCACGKRYPCPTVAAIRDVDGRLWGRLALDAQRLIFRSDADNGRADTGGTGSM